MSKKTLFHYAAPAIITGMLFAAVAVSWEEPGSNPPDGNVPAPINVSAFGQYKEGKLNIGSNQIPDAGFLQMEVRGGGALRTVGGAILNTGGAANSTGLIVGNGNVGIGTTDPKEKLHVAGDAVRVTDSSAEIQFDQTNVSPNGDWLFKTFGNGLRIRVGDVDTDSWSEKVTILNNGRVGIGTVDPSAKLEVNGGNIKVTGGSFIDDGTTLSVPDYVFDSEYDLESLLEVEKFILEYKHLKGLPDMDDTEGWAELSMQDRDMKLLEKIEELTLYIIELEKKVTELENKK